VHAPGLIPTSATISETSEQFVPQYSVGASVSTFHLEELGLSFSTTVLTALLSSILPWQDCRSDTADVSSLLSCDELQVELFLMAANIYT
jgi:hypothetical protein